MRKGPNSSKCLACLLIAAPKKDSKLIKRSLRTFRPLSEQDAFASRRSHKVSQNVTRNVPRKRPQDEGREASLATKKTVRITIETERHFVIRRATSARVWCELCANEVNMVRLESAAEVAQVDAKTI